MIAYFRILGDTKYLNDLALELNCSYTIEKTINNDISLKLFEYKEDTLDSNDLLRKIIDNLSLKIALLNEYRKKYDLEYYFFRVAYLNESNKPILSLDKDVIEFFYKISACDDLDYYLC